MRKPLTVADAEAIKAQASAVEDLAVTAPNVGYSGGPFDDNITYQGHNYRWGNTEGVTPNYANIVNVTIREGRFITESDEEQRRNVMVIGVNAADALFPGKPDNIAGTEVRMGGYNFEIIGVLEKRKAGFFGENEEDNGQPKTDYSGQASLHGLGKLSTTLLFASATSIRPSAANATPTGAALSSVGTSLIC